MRQTVSVRLDLDRLAERFRPQFVPAEAKARVRAIEGGSQRDPELTAIEVEWTWDGAHLEAEVDQSGG